ncbi:MAG: hypothetical protein L3J78_01175, partial [Thermoplasmata archaeon]|nr:hypothetical protein [Thermoplasmata archaeon]
MNGNANGNTVQTVRSGQGGNSTTGVRGTFGGSAGQAAGIWAFGVDGTGNFQYNFVNGLTGGTGGTGRTTAGWGGNVSGLLVVGDGSPFNDTIIQGNWFNALTGGTGGTATNGGGTGGGVTGVAAVHVRPDSTSNTISVLTGGTGGNAFIGGNPAGRGGDATAFIVGLSPLALSSTDTITTITKGTKGVGAGNPASYGTGVYAGGNVTIHTRVTITNATFTAISSLELSIDNYTEATTVNTPFSTTKLFVGPAANLTVRNFLSVAIYWPNNITLVPGASILVRDDGTTVWNLVSS